MCKNDDNKKDYQSSTVSKLKRDAMSEVEWKSKVLDSLNERDQIEKSNIQMFASCEYGVICISSLSQNINME